VPDPLARRIKMTCFCAASWYRVQSKATSGDLGVEVRRQGIPVSTALAPSHSGWGGRQRRSFRNGSGLVASRSFPRDRSSGSFTGGVETLPFHRAAMSPQ